MIGISSRQADVLDYIKKSLCVRGIPPTIREIADQIGHKFVGSVTPMVRALIKKGFVKKPRKWMSRGIVPVGMSFVESGRHTNDRDSSMIVEVVIETTNGKTKRLRLACRSIVIRKCGPTMGRARKRQ
jgi:SOS-response transcriptional repressor LexA